jgi:hypothetical protein
MARMPSIISHRFGPIRYRLEYGSNASSTKSALSLPTSFRIKILDADNDRAGRDSIPLLLLVWAKSPHAEKKISCQGIGSFAGNRLAPCRTCQTPFLDMEGYFALSSCYLLPPPANSTIKFSLQRNRNGVISTSSCSAGNYRF